jgi:hypothetical protein
MIDYPRTISVPSYMIPGSPAALLTVIPNLLGFVPESSFVVIGAAAGIARVTLRYDLPDPANPEGSADLAGHAVAILQSQRLAAAVAAGYGPDPLVRPLAAAFAGAARAAGITIAALLRTDGDRYWSYSHPGQECAPPGGTVTGPAERTAAAAVSGPDAKVLISRQALAGTLAPLGGVTAERMRDATRRAQQHISQILTSAAKTARPGAARRAIAREGLPVVADIISAYQTAGQYPHDDQIAFLTVVLQDLRVRDDAWSRMDPRYGAAHLRMWTEIVRLACPGYVAPAASLLAFVAWQSGDGALANLALDRALADDPGYSMAGLLRQVISSGAPPSMARLPMTPEDVAACYEDLDGDDANDELEDDESEDEDDYNQEEDDDQEDYDSDEEYEPLDGPCPVCGVSPGSSRRESADATA